MIDSLPWPQLRTVYTIERRERAIESESRFKCRWVCESIRCETRNIRCFIQNFRDVLVSRQGRNLSSCAGDRVQCQKYLLRELSRPIIRTLSPTPAIDDVIVLAIDKQLPPRQSCTQRSQRARAIVGMRSVTSRQPCIFHRKKNGPANKWTLPRGGKKDWFVNCVNYSKKNSVFVQIQIMPYELSSLKLEFFSNFAAGSTLRIWSKTSFSICWWTL